MEQQTKDYIKLSVQGFTPKQIAAIFNVNSHSVRDALNRYGLGMAAEKERLYDELTEKIRRLAMSGMTKTQIARELKVSRKVIYRRIWRGEVEMKLRPAHPVRKPKSRWRYSLSPEDRAHYDKLVRSRLGRGEARRMMEELLAKRATSAQDAVPTRGNQQEQP